MSGDLPEMCPIDPRAVPVAELRHRVAALLDGVAGPHDDPIPPGHYRCGVCQRQFRKALSDEQADEEMRRRFGDLPPAERYLICGDCNEIISADVGEPL